MTRRRFYAPPDAFAPDGAGVQLSPEESRHLRDVLRLRAGDEAFVFDGEGREFACVVVETGSGGGRGALARLEVRGRAEPPSPESSLRLSLGVALLKGEKFDLVVQKATELGASRIVPIVSRRADVRLRDERDAGGRVERWRRLALEASKQSGRARVPPVEMPAAFGNFVAAGTDADGARLMFAERGGGDAGALVRVGLSEFAGGVEGSRPTSVMALVGPEGGWEEEEVALASERGWTIITLGGRTLRAETAAITVAALLQHLFGDMR